MSEDKIIGSSEIREFDTQDSESFFVEIQDIVSNVLERSKRMADLIKAKARQEGYEDGFEQGREEGYKKGYEEGYQKGYDKGIEDLSEMVKFLKNLGEEILSERHRLFEEYKYEMVQMVLEISKRLIFEELLVRPEIISNIIHNAISMIKEKESIKIIVSPAVFGLIIDRNLSDLSGGKVELVSDDRLDNGDIIIISPGGQIEFRLKERFKEIEESFRNVFLDISRSQ